MHELYMFMVERLGSINDLMLVSKHPPFAAEFIKLLNDKEDESARGLDVK